MGIRSVSGRSPQAAHSAVDNQARPWAEASVAFAWGEGGMTGTRQSVKLGQAVPAHLRKT